MEILSTLEEIRNEPGIGTSKNNKAIALDRFSKKLWRQMLDFSFDNLRIYIPLE